MATPPDFTNGTALDASSLDKIGLWKVAAGTFTAVTSVDITGFSSDYTRYRLIFHTRRVDTVGMGTFVAKLHNGSTPISANYYEGAAYFNYLGTVGSAYTRNNASDWVWGNSDSAAAESLWTYDIYALSTDGATFVMAGFSVGQAAQYNGGGSNGNTSAYDRIRITFDYGTHTGRWTLYGYNDI